MECLILHFTMVVRLSKQPVNVLHIGVGGVAVSFHLPIGRDDELPPRAIFNPLVHAVVCVERCVERDVFREVC